MRKPKFDADVYVALRNAGMNNRTIAEKLGVDEASVRRGLKNAPPPPRYVFTLEPWSTP